MHSTNKKI